MKFQDQLHFGHFLNQNIVYFKRTLFFEKYLELYTKEINNIKKMNAEDIQAFQKSQIKEMYTDISNHLDNQHILDMKNIFRNQKIEFSSEGETFYVIE
jgi:hypothetical protein